MNIALFASGSSGNCALVSDGETHILIDAGISARRICAGLTAQDVAPADLAGVLVTHEHSDHVKGLAVLLRRDPTAVYALPAVCAALRKLLPERTDCLHEVAPGEPFCLGDVRVTPFPTPHDAAGSCGYRLDGSARFGFCTDLGTVTDAVRAALCGVDCAVIEANHDPELLRTGPYPIYLKRRIASDHGHLSNESAGALAVYLAENGAQQLILGHLSRENNTPRAALETVSLALAAAGFQPGTQPELYAAPAETTLALTAGKACVCVGKMRETYYISAFAEYAKRLGAYCRFDLVELPEQRLPERPSQKEIHAALEKEAQAIRARIPKGAAVIAMCVEGKLLSSEALARQLAGYAAGGTSKVCFLVGGSFGLDEGLKREASLRLSMAPMTFPHHLARVMLAEQIYRACTINAGTQYHK